MTLDEILAAVETAVQTGSNFLSPFTTGNPQMAAALFIANIVAKEAPELVKDVEKLFSKAPVTAETKQGIAEDINALLHPETA